MFCDVRKMSSSDSIKFMKKHVLGRRPRDIKWGESDVFIKYGRKYYSDKGIELKVRLKSKNDKTVTCVYISFYTGVDNIRFDGVVVDEEVLKGVEELIAHGKSKSVFDFIGSKSIFGFR